MSRHLVVGVCLHVSLAAVEPQHPVHEEEEDEDQGEAWE